MKCLEQLNDIAQEALGGLNAGQELKLNIQKAARAGKKRRMEHLLRPVIAAAAALVILVAAGTLLPGALHPGTAPGELNDVLDSHPAGQSTSEPGRALALLDIPPGSISLSAGNQTPEYRSIWAPSSGGNFPLIGVNGRFYRMLRNPSSIPQNLLAGGVGQVAEFTQEPALADINQIISNAVSQGETVYSVSGMDGALVAANVGGELKVFQRVSFANNAVIGRESLSQTLGISGNVVGMELTDVGTVSDQATAAYLADVLVSNATFVNAAGSQSSKSSLLIQLSNGLFVQMFVKNDSLSACGSWSCPEFFDAFRDAVK